MMRSLNSWYWTENYWIDKTLYIIAQSQSLPNTLHSLTLITKWWNFYRQRITYPRNLLLFCYQHSGFINHLLGLNTTRNMSSKNGQGSMGIKIILTLFFCYRFVSCLMNSYSIDIKSPKIENQDKVKSFIFIWLEPGRFFVTDNPKNMLVTLFTMIFYWDRKIDCIFYIAEL